MLAPHLRRYVAVGRVQPPLVVRREPEREAEDHHPPERDQRRVALPVGRVAVPAARRRPHPLGVRHLGAGAHGLRWEERRGGGEELSVRVQWYVQPGEPRGKTKGKTK